ncbi:hypothetical protein QTP88_015578 [Uroleucon formosanum]
MTELNACASSLESRILNIGKIFTIRWVASSFKTVHAVWNNYVALHKHFQESSIDNERDGKERSKYLGLNNMLTSKDFVFNLGLAKAHSMINLTVRILDSMIEIHGPKLTEVILANEEIVFKGIQLHIHKSVQKINSRQFFRSISNNLKSRLFTTQSSHVSNAFSNLFKETYDQLLADLNVFDSNAWPDNVNIQYGDDSIRRLSQKFQVDEISAVRGFRELKNTRDEIIADLKILTSAIKTIAISSSECERAFSSMNEIVSPKRNTLSSEHISSLKFINAVGPPVEKIHTTKWIESWVKKGKRLATEEKCPKRIKIAEENSYKSLWNLIKN